MLGIVVKPVLLGIRPDNRPQNCNIHDIGADTVDGDALGLERPNGASLSPAWLTAQMINDFEIISARTGSRSVRAGCSDEPVESRKKNQGAPRVALNQKRYILLFRKM